MRLPPPINSLERLQQKIALLEVGAACLLVLPFRVAVQLVDAPPRARSLTAARHAHSPAIARFLAPPAQTLGEVHVAAGVLQQSRAARRSVHPLDTVHTALRCSIAPLGEADAAMGVTIKQ